MDQSPREEKTPVTVLLERAMAALSLGHLDKAQHECQLVLRSEPSHPQAIFLLGVIASRVGKSDKAIDLIRDAISLSPYVALYHNHLGLVYLSLNQYNEAIAAFDRAINLDPNAFRAIANKANVYVKQDKLDLACDLLEEVLRRSPGLAEVRYNLANTLRQQGKLPEAIAHYEQAIRDNPKLSEPYNNLGNALEKVGQVPEAVHHYRRAIERNPQNWKAYSNLICALHYCPGTTAADLWTLTQEWQSQLTGALPPQRTVWPNTPELERPLRIGYLGSHLHQHPQSFFLEPVLLAHDRKQFHVYCYSDSRCQDGVNRRLRTFVSVWRDTSDWNDATLVQQIRHDQVDILVDLSWHTAHNRLLVLAQKPAPIQVSWGDGPVATTGLKTMDYLIGDRFHCLPGVGQWSVETIYTMPHSYISYHPPISALAPSPPPCFDRRCITFGSFNKLSKLSDRALELWSQVLHAVPRSRLLLKAHYLDNATIRERLVSRFLHHGILAERLELHGSSPQTELLATYKQVDIALDTFPYSGGVTTLESLWMGVPVITLWNSYGAASHSVSHLTNLGFPQWVAQSPKDFVQLAVSLSEDVAALRSYRRQLREQLLCSPLCDGPTFTWNLEYAYRGMWREWCLKQ